MLNATRRSFLIGSAVLPIGAAMARIVEENQDSVAADLEQYIGFGSKLAGGPGDNACGAWLGTELESLGFKVERQEIAVPWFTPQRSELRCGSATAALWPQPVVIPTGPDGITGRLVRVDSNGRSDAALEDAIALLDLPFGRWSTALAKPIKGPIESAFGAGAQAVVAITNGPSGKVIALNADGRASMFPRPVALLAPEDARPFLAAAMDHAQATMVITGEGGRRPAFNLVGRIDRGASSWVAISTPRSGWYCCAGERGGGVAAWLWLARWASAALRNYNLAFICNSGHEHEYLGAAEALGAIAPKPADTRFWLHLGANFASRDWHDGTGRPLPSVDTQRYLSVTPSLVSLAQEVFAGHAGFEVPYSSEVVAAGEQTEVLAAGYKDVAAVFGIHRYHHVATDTERCVSAAQVAVTAAAFQQFVARIV
jgi:hypothetical protein